MKKSQNFSQALILFRTNALLIFALAFLLAAVQPASAQGNTVGETIWYVSTTGNDANSCSATDAPCLTINGAIGKAANGDTIQVAIGIYTAASGNEVVLINKSVTLSGGWEETFTAQSGRSTIDGQGARRGIKVNSSMTATMDRFFIQNGFHTSQGGGIHNQGTLSLNNSIITNNKSEWMGGGIINFGTLIINNSTISQNSAGKTCCSGGGGGGGIQNSAGSLNINNSTIHSNQILGWFSGSGINTYITATLNNTTISGNTGGSGEGIYILNGNITFNNSTITNNQTYGFYNEFGSVTLQNTIVAGNQGPSDCIGTMMSQGYNLIGKATNCSFTPTTGDQIGTSASPINPFMGSLQDHGGLTLTHALYSNSPALNAGNPAIPGSGGDTCLGTDQRGVARPVGSACDIGAYEGSITVATSITRVNPNPTGAAAVNYAVKFSEAVTNVDITDFSLEMNSVTGASITNITGADDTYTVTVNTGAGAGAIRLKLIDDDSILDTSSNPLGGTGTGNGNFTIGEVYTILNPIVSSITRINANPPSTVNIKFLVIFSETVSNVDITDFSLTKTGATGATITQVTGTGDRYNVTISTSAGKGNGTVRLDVIDDDSILDNSNNPLGGTGNGNGNFTSGETYTITRVPTTQSPASSIADPTPTFEWSKITGATKYQYQLYKGATLIYTKTAMANSCNNSSCSSAPTNVLVPGLYKWKVRALVGGVWRNFSPYKSFVLFLPEPGFWSWTDDSPRFYLLNSSTVVADFSILVRHPTCGLRRITHTDDATINGKNFNLTGSFSVSGTFTNATTVSGTLALINYYLPGCGYGSGGPYPWTAVWRSGAQPDVTLNNGDIPELTVSPEFDTPFDIFTLDPEK
jgi:hypothetical protein